MKKIFLHAIIFITSALCLTCTEESCDLETGVTVHAGFYSTESLEQISIDSLDVYGLDIPDSSLYSMAATDNIELPLNPSANGCSFVISNAGRADTLVISYQPNLLFLSRACGYIYTFELKEVQFTANDIFNILIINNSVNPGDEENIQIFF